MEQIMQWMSNVLPKSVDEQSAENRQHQFTVAGKSIHVWSNYGHNSRWLIAKEPNYFGWHGERCQLEPPTIISQHNGVSYCTTTTGRFKPKVYKMNWLILQKDILSHLISDLCLNNQFSCLLWGLG